MEFYYWNTVEAVVLEGMIGDGVLFESQRTRIHRVGPKLQGHDWCIHHDSRRRCGGYSMSSVFWYFMCVGSEESQKKDSYSWWSKEFISFYINLAVFSPQRNPNRVQSIPAVAFGVSIFVPGHLSDGEGRGWERCVSFIQIYKILIPIYYAETS